MIQKWYNRTYTPKWAFRRVNKGPWTRGTTWDPFDSDLSKDEKKVTSYQKQIEEINIDEMLEKDENEVLYGRAGYLSGGLYIL